MLAARRGEEAGIGDKRFLSAFGYPGSGTELKGLWEHLIETVSARGSLAPDTGRLLEHYLRHGTLATRIGKAVGLLPTRAKLMRVYEELCEALADAQPFAPPAPTLLVSCEHGGNRVPKEYAPLFADAAAVLATHRGYDIGALEVARDFGRRLGVTPFTATTTRLVVDLNRSPGNRDVFSAYTPLAAGRASAKRRSRRTTGPIARPSSARSPRSSMPASRCCMCPRTASRPSCAARCATATSAFSTIRDGPARCGSSRRGTPRCRRRRLRSPCGATILISASRTRSSRTCGGATPRAGTSAWSSK